ncbi:MAG: TonB-dependent receptor [Pseudomonadota bacterium]
MSEKSRAVAARRACAAVMALSMSVPAWASHDNIDLGALADLSLEQLSRITVTSAAGRPESLLKTSSSLFVITGEDIRRSAATSLPEALRLAPNLQVAQLNASQYAISARGFNNAIGNKLLVLIDGRTVYSALFSGVFWDANDVVLEDIDRIEVISGPGSTVWGANAVNGVINIITRPAAATQGTLVSAVRAADGGYLMGRYGGTLGEGGHYRIYALAMDHDNTSRADGVERLDAASKQQGGFRADWGARQNRFTLQGDIYTGGKEPANNTAPLLSGANLLARWEGHFASGSPFKLQAYVDRAERDDVNAFRNRADTVDLQFSHQPNMPTGHALLWGASLRHTRDVNQTSPLVRFAPGTRSLSWASVFAQHDLQLSDPLQLTLGLKAERNDYTGIEVLPNLRLGYAHSPEAYSWLALSRSVRAPARLDREFFAPGVGTPFILGGPNFESEVANVIELGHRGFAAPGISYSVTAFRQHYTKLRSGSQPPITLVNQIEGAVNGVEGWATWQAAPSWRLSGGFLGLHKNLASTRGTPDPAGVAGLGNDPRMQWSLRSSLNLGARSEFDVIVRHVGALPSPQVERYTAVDARLSWRINRQLELSLLGQNIFDSRHIEFNAIGVASQIERRFFVKAVWAL